MYLWHKRPAKDRKEPDGAFQVSDTEIFPLMGEKNSLYKGRALRLFFILDLIF